MSSDSSPKHQRLKKWFLLIMSLIAVTIWMRNLFYVFPGGSSGAVHDEAGPPRLTSASTLLIRPDSFDDSAGWHDPFSAPLSVFRPHVSRDSSVRRGVAPSRPVPEPPPWKLAGVVWNARSPSAILTSTDGSRRIVVARGDTLGAARVERIDQSNIWIRHRGHSWKLTWEADGNAP